MRILGVSAFYHDSAAALLQDGVLRAAAQEERFTRERHDASFPRHAIAYCLEAAGVAPREIDYVAFYDKPFLKFDRILETYLAFAPRGFRSFRRSFPVWIREKLFLKRLLEEELTALDGHVDWRQRLLFAEHHVSHAASAFYPSPFADAAVLTLDGVGEWATASAGWGRGRELTLTREIDFPHSLGLLYSAVTGHLGFKVNSGEYKVMGLAPYGEPRFARTLLDRVVDVKPDGSFRLDLRYFDYCTGDRMASDELDALVGGRPRRADEPLERRHLDLAASVQHVCEEIVLRMTRSLAEESGATSLCLAGGVALNCVANGKVLRDGRFRDIWVQPAAGDAGGAVGAALAAHHGHLGSDRPAPSGDAMFGAYLGPSYSTDEVARRLRAMGAVLEVVEPESELLRTTVDALEAGHAVGWFQGRMEFGPRALGARSILADPRRSDARAALNLKVKFRESVRPFAPAVPRERVAEWFELDADSPYMLLVADVHPSRRVPLAPEDAALTGLERRHLRLSEIPAVTHVDNSARVQTVHAETHPRFHALLEAFGARTGCPVLVNTSFNVRGEPIVCTPEDALRCFLSTDIELLVAESCVLRKSDQPAALRTAFRPAVRED
jgi:carbamoyltransferase